MATGDLDSNKYHMISPKGKKFLIAGSILFVVFILPMLMYLYYSFAVNRPSQTGNEVTLEIETGDSTSEIASLLYQNDVINSEFLFKFYVTINQLQNNIQAGIYTIPAGTSLKDLAQILQHGTNDKNITVLEGWRAEEVAKHLSLELKNVDYIDFLKIAKEHEGYLFPDTYNFNINADEETVLQALLATFESKTNELLSQESLTKAGLTKEETIILASIVEREVNTSEDRPIVAGILIKRWRDGELVGADATTQYTIAALRYGCSENPAQICTNMDENQNINWWPHDLTIAELELESPYNTRKMPGLPPTPIANPGLNSIEAVVNYETSDYYYYLTDSSGITHYAQTLVEHNTNIELYL